MGIKAAPVVRALLKEMGQDIVVLVEQGVLVGTGKNGFITKADLEKILSDGFLKRLKEDTGYEEPEAPETSEPDADPFYEDDELPNSTPAIVSSYIFLPEHIGLMRFRSGNDLAQLDEVRGGKYLLRAVKRNYFAPKPTPVALKPRAERTEAEELAESLYISE